ncbi:polyhydroxyalkanoate synthesis regulator DNA-binding domain-containing protein [Aeoliella mucimassa]|uniref:PHB/PHA accumulation regulator DNA-binding domain protein n=1 Tax=Aeoliella mucimassa TaxID=2527972 RepID=A0A518AQ20_9BACT|nr:polyhydroxyalkanoate synthesis regulator DNA-binding domain-containing protein [Aeoliella mucimassa]QDU56818.1 PHB/PHA accumulation regulator DNA-binding domain protein [Aeoliella mucimassa]
MPDSRFQIKRYPNRRYYAKPLSKYVSLQEIEQLIQEGQTVEIRDSQTGEELTRAVLTQIIVERHPDKMELFPTDLLHFILRSNDTMSSFLRDYFRQSLTYLDYLYRHSPGAPRLAQPMHWVKTWLDSVVTKGGDPQPASPTGDQLQLTERMNQLEERLNELEGRGE